MLTEKECCAVHIAKEELIDAILRLLEECNRAETEMVYGLLLGLREGT